jgi:Zn-dependent M28 family amino/carboxypeptidase
MSDPSLAEALDAAAPGGLPTTLSLRIGERPSDQRLLKNVAGLLPGSSPALRESYVLLTAHYDGTGSYQGDSQDRIWNAANDNASGAAAVIEIAAALSALAEKPRRSILFVCFFGEEKGMLGSRHYADNPLVPIDRTVAAINLEQLGRTDATEGDQTGRANVTGYDYSEVGEILRLAGEHTGIRVSKSEKFSDFYFVASDNIALARLGVPSHTFSVSYQFPDYHGAGDEWQKFDFANMEKVVRTAALAVLFMAQSDRVPQWDAANPRAERFARIRASRGRPGGNKD